MTRRGLMGRVRGQRAVVFEGREITGLNEDALARWRRERIGIVFQDFHLIPAMTALENVAVPLELAGRRDAMRVATEALASVGLAHRLTHLPGQLSGGEQQRVALARAFAGEPQLLLADEPTGNLDPETAARVHDELLRLIEDEGLGALVATHNLDLAEGMSRIARLERGMIVS